MNYDTLSPEQIQELQDQEYYWITYSYPRDDDETWAVGKYNKKYKWFNLCEGIVVTVKYVHEIHLVEHPV